MKQADKRYLSTAAGVEQTPSPGNAGGLAAVILLTSMMLMATGCAALVVGGAGSGSDYPQSSRSEAAQSADQKISEAVRAELRADRLLAAANIEVATNNGVVTLDGSVANYTARAQAETLTAGIKGVRGIHNRLKIAGGM